MNVIIPSIDIPNIFPMNNALLSNIPNVSPINIPNVS
jgi:hypothetical protein